MNKKRLIGLLAGALCLVPVAAAHAGLTDQEKALWGASAQAPTTFAVPAGQDAAVMAQALSLITDWDTRDRYMWTMPVRTRTTTLIQTDEPTALNLIGFKVLDTPTAGGAVISVDTSSYEGKAFQISQQHRDAAKRAHLLAYLLEQFAGVPTTAVQMTPLALTPPMPAPAAVSPTDPFEPSLRRLRAQLDAGQFDAALGTLDSLHAAVADRAKASVAAGAGK